MLIMVSLNLLLLYEHLQGSTLEDYVQGIAPTQFIMFYTFVVEVYLVDLQQNYNLFVTSNR